MKNFIFAVLTVAVTVIGLDAQTNTGRKRDEASIKSIVRHMETAWNKRSGQIFAEVFAADSDYVVIDGTHVKGRQANADGHQYIFDTVYADSRLSLEVEDIRFPVPRTAIAHVRGALLVRQNDPASSVGARMTLFLVKTGNKWEIEAFQNTRIVQPSKGGAN